MSYFGNVVQSELNEATRDAKDAADSNYKAQMVLDSWLKPQDLESKPQAGRFADPALLFAQ